MRGGAARIRRIHNHCSHPRPRPPRIILSHLSRVAPSMWFYREISYSSNRLKPPESNPKAQRRAISNPDSAMAIDPGTRSNTTMSPKPHSLRFPTDDGLELHCLHWRAPDSEKIGTDIPLVLLHGGGANAHWWDHLGPRLAATRPVYALDFRGHGDSSHPETREIGAFNLDLEAMLAWLGRAEVDLVGHSLGATVALDHASRFAATRSIALVDLPRGHTRGSGRRARLALSLKRTYRSHDEAVERFRFLPESSHASEKLRAHIANHSVRAEPDGRFGYKFDPGWFGLPPRTRPDPKAIHCPVLLLRGAKSQLLSATTAREFVAELPDGKLVEIAEAGHHIFLDQPEVVLESLLGFFEISNATISE